jgi:bifunctional non-homologous end joining protein LigD
MPERTPTTVEGRSLVLSHLDKVLWPATGMTKAEALHYYAQVAPAMLPHLRGRAATFVRFPDGVEAERFYTKNPPPGTPDWVATVAVDGRDGRRTHVVVNDLASLMALANLAALEMHVPQWRDGRPEVHDRLVVDLDPGPGAGLVECCHVACLVRDAMAEDGLKVWAKTSGAKGLHLYVPLTAAPAERVTGYARDLARRLEEAHPALVVHRMAKALRPGKVFVDWSQNASAKTTAAPYTLRARPVPAVSTPVGWEEIEACTTARDLAFTPDEVVDRVTATGDLMEGLADPARAFAL